MIWALTPMNLSLAAVAVASHGQERGWTTGTSISSAVRAAASDVAVRFSHVRRGDRDTIYAPSFRKLEYASR